MRTERTGCLMAHSTRNDIRMCLSWVSSKVSTHFSILLFVFINCLRSLTGPGLGSFVWRISFKFPLLSTQTQLNKTNHVQCAQNQVKTIINCRRVARGEHGSEIIPPTVNIAPPYKAWVIVLNYVPQHTRVKFNTLSEILDEICDLVHDYYFLYLYWHCQNMSPPYKH